MPSARVTFVGKYPDFLEGTPPCSGADPDAYFPEKGNSGSTTREIQMAKSICKTCPYQSQCLDWAINNHELGIWGGTTERERRSIRRSRRVA
jgi:WhiB family redox-sensing transcriptional regulator